MWDLIFVAAAIAIDWIITPIAAYRGTRHSDAGRVAKPTLADFQFPTTAKDRAIPVGYGTFKVAAPNLCWYGNLSYDVDRIDGKVVSYQSILGLYYQLCLGPLVAANGDGFLEVRFEDKTAWKSDVPVLDQEIFIEQTALFGGKGFGGGVSGYVRLLSGRYDQVKDEYLQKAIFAQTGNKQAISRSLSTPPTNIVHYDAAAKVVWDMYIVGPNPTGLWAGHENELAYPLTLSPITQWSFRRPDKNELVDVEDESVTVSWDGTTWQDVSALATEIPAWRGRVAVVFGRLDADGTPTGFNVGEGANLRPPEFVLCRFPVALGSGKANINGDANPMEILYEVLTGRLPRASQPNGTVTPYYGLAIPPSMLDLDTMRSLASLLFDESRGWSGLFDQAATTAEAFALDLCDYCGFVPYTDLATGKCTFTAIREDYDVEGLLHLTPSNSELVEYTPGDWNNTFNEVRATYVSRENNFAETSARPVVDPANLAIVGESRVLELSIPGCSNETLAQVLSEEALRTVAYPLAGARIRVNRQAHTLHKGSVVVWDYAPYGVSSLLFRVIDIDYGAPGAGDESEKITLTLLEDRFAAGTAVAAPLPRVGWVNPIRPPERALYQSVFELPYFLYRQNGQLPTWQEHGMVCTVAARANASCTSYAVLERVGEDEYIRRGEGFAFTPAALLVQEYPENTDAIDRSGTLIVQSGIDLGMLRNTTPAFIAASGFNLAFIGDGSDDGKVYDEVVAFETITSNGNGTWTLSSVWRGLLDTVPKTHEVGKPIWFVHYGLAILPDQHDNAVSLDLLYLPQTARGELPQDEASPLRVTLSNRALDPYAPGRVRINDEPWPVALPGDDDVTATWSHRNRTKQNHVWSQDEYSVEGGPEANAPNYPYADNAYVVKVYGENDAILLESYDLTRDDTEFVFTTAEEAARTVAANPSLGRLNDHLTLKLFGFRADQGATQYAYRTLLSEPQVRRFDMAGYGAHYGDYYGGY